jgi:hypothetical protein
MGVCVSMCGHVSMLHAYHFTGGYAGSVDVLDKLVLLELSLYDHAFSGKCGRRKSVASCICMKDVHFHFCLFVTHLILKPSVLSCAGEFIGLTHYSDTEIRVRLPEGTGVNNDFEIRPAGSSDSIIFSVGYKKPELSGWADLDFYSGAPTS